jgi:hypothetical protein
MKSKAWIQNKRPLSPHKVVAFWALVALFFQGAAAYGAGMDSYTASGSARNAEEALKTSKEIITFLDATVTNVGKKKHRKLYQKIITQDLKARIYFRSFRYSRSYQVSRNAQKHLVQLLKSVSKMSLKESKWLLDRFTPVILSTPSPKKNKPRHFLHMGYRGYRSAKEQIKKTQHLFPPHMYKLRIHGYREALNTLKKSRRYALKAYLYLNTPMKQRTGLTKLTFIETGKILWDQLEKQNRSRIISWHFVNYNHLRYDSLKRKYFMSDETSQKVSKGSDLGTPTTR